MFLFNECPVRNFSTTDLRPSLDKRLTVERIESVVFTHKYHSQAIASCHSGRLKL